MSLAVAANPAAHLASGIADPRGRWQAQCEADGTPSVAAAELQDDGRAKIGRDFRRRTRERIGS